MVVTGLSGSGKDTVIEKLLEKQTSFRRLVTCADRPPRPGEIHGVHYYFVSANELDRMHKNRELVEAPLTYGTSRKATPKKEFLKIIEDGESLIWRIESSLAAHVASGRFFEEQFNPGERTVLKKSTTIVFLTADKEDLDKRRKARDGKDYNSEDFAKRDKQDEQIMKDFGHLFTNIIENKEGEIEETISKIERLL